MVQKKVIILLSLVFIHWHWFEPVAKHNQNGLKAYEAGKFDQALQYFLSARGLQPDSHSLKNNTAEALYQLKKYQEALEEFSKIDPTRQGMDPADFYYNLGNTQFRSNQFDKALESYKKSLRHNPDDLDTKKNFELTLKKIQEQQQQKEQDKKKQEEDQKEQDKKQEQQQQKQNEQQMNNIMQYLDQNEAKQMKEKKRAFGIVRNEKDW